MTVTGVRGDTFAEAAPPPLAKPRAPAHEDLEKRLHRAVGASLQPEQSGKASPQDPGPGSHAHLHTLTTFVSCWLSIQLCP